MARTLRLPEEARQTLNLWAATDAERYSGVPDPCGGFGAVLDALVPGLVMLRDELACRADQAGLGRPRNERAHHVVETMAEVHAVTHKQRPNDGRDDHGQPTGTFGKTLAAVFSKPCIGVTDVARVAKAAACKPSPGAQPGRLRIRFGALNDHWTIAQPARPFN